MIHCTNLSMLEDILNHIHMFTGQVELYNINSRLVFNSNGVKVISIRLENYEEEECEECEECGECAIRINVFKDVPRKTPKGTPKEETKCKPVNTVKRHVRPNRVSKRRG